MEFWIKLVIFVLFILIIYEWSRSTQIELPTSDEEEKLYLVKYHDGSSILIFAGAKAANEKALIYSMTEFIRNSKIATDEIKQLSDGSKVTYKEINRTPLYGAISLADEVKEWFDDVSDVLNPLKLVRLMAGYYVYTNYLPMRLVFAYSSPDRRAVAMYVSANGKCHACEAKIYDEIHSIKLSTPPVKEIIELKK